MTKKSVRFGLLLGLLLVTLLALPSSMGCRRSRNLGAVGDANTPIIFLLSPSHGQHLSPAQQSALSRHLTAATGMIVDVWVAPSEQAAIHSISANRADLALLPLFDYLFVQREYGAKASLRVLRDQHADRYSGVVLVKADSSAQTLRDLANRKVAFVAPWSATGFILPARMLADLGVRPEAVFTGSHAASLAMLQAGQVDAAVTYAGAAPQDGSLRVLATTPTVPNEPILYRRGLSAAKREKLDRALIEYAATDPGKQALAELANVTGLVPTSDAAYAEAIEVLRQHGKRIEDLVADGWKITNENQMPLSSYAP